MPLLLGWALDVCIDVVQALEAADAELGATVDLLLLQCVCACVCVVWCGAEAQCSVEENGGLVIGVWCSWDNKTAGATSVPMGEPLDTTTAM